MWPKWTLLTTCTIVANQIWCDISPSVFIVAVQSQILQHFSNIDGIKYFKNQTTNYTLTWKFHAMFHVKQLIIQMAMDVAKSAT
jgi:hypothetical protein